MVVGTHTHHFFMRSSECRRIAECCRRLARRQTDARRATLLTCMARAWQTLANQADRYEQLPALFCKRRGLSSFINRSALLANATRG